jgi:dolichol-phosphate mannosyltransferase
MGLIVGFANLFYIAYIVWVYTFKTDVIPGWTTQSLQFSIVGFFLFLSIFVLAEYIGRILYESKNRPFYFIKEERNSSVLLSSENQTNVVKE